jgi:hypothetical protein
MQTSILRGPFVRGLAILAFFAVVGVFLIPTYVPRPAFIPGFAPPPDMWPRTVSIIGAALGLLAVILAVKSGPTMAEPLETDGASLSVQWVRFIEVVGAFSAFLVLVPCIGFAAASVLLIATTIFLTGERGHRLWAVGLSVLGPISLVMFFNSALGTQFPVGALAKSFGL